MTQVSGGKTFTTTRPVYASATAIPNKGHNMAKDEFAVTLSEAAVEKLKAATEAIKNTPGCKKLKVKRQTVTTLASCALAIENTVNDPAFAGTLQLLGEDVAPVIPAASVVAAPAWAVGSTAGVTAAAAAALIALGGIIFSEKAPADVIIKPVVPLKTSCHASKAAECTKKCSVSPYAENYRLKYSSKCSSSCHTITACGAKATSTTETIYPTDKISRIDDKDFFRDFDTFTNTGEEPMVYSNLGSLESLLNSLGLSETFTSKALPKITTHLPECTSYLQKPHNECRLILNPGKSGVKCPPPTKAGQTCTVSDSK
jgi:hypothetical protein